MRNVSSGYIAAQSLMPSAGYEDNAVKEKELVLLKQKLTNSISALQVTRCNQMDFLARVFGQMNSFNESKKEAPMPAGTLGELSDLLSTLDDLISSVFNNQRRIEELA